MKLFISFLMILSGVTAFYSQEVTVTATTDKREIAKILRKEQEATRINQAFFAEDAKCRGFLKTREWTKAESSCRAGILLVEKLPKEHVLERSGVRASLAIALLWQERVQEATDLLNKSIEIRNTVSSDSDADTGDLYYLLGQAHAMSNDFQGARSKFDKAERIYRAAIVEIGDDDFRVDYSRRLRDAVVTHYDLVKLAGPAEEVEKLRERVAQVEKEFGKFLSK